MKVVLTLVVFSVLTILPASAVDYCASSLCPAGKKHIACNNNGQVDSKNCGANLQIVKPALMKYVALRQINEYRNDVAAVDHPLTPPASRMPLAVWDDELAKIAEFIVKRCSSTKEDLCISTPTYPNVTSLYFKADATDYPNTDFAKLFESAMTQWRSTERYMSKEEIISPTELFLKDSDFAIMLNEKASRIGCAGLQHRVSSDSVSFLAACLFSSKNIPGVPLYTIGVPARDCQTGTSKCYTALCTEN